MHSQSVDEAMVKVAQTYWPKAENGVRFTSKQQVSSPTPFSSSLHTVAIFEFSAGSQCPCLP